MNRIRQLMMGVATTAAAVVGGTGHAQIVINELVVDVQPGEHAHDIEVWNSGSERAYVALDPREITAPGTSFEAGREDPDPERLGLLVAPEKLILEPGQRRLVRIAALAAPTDRERVYRVTAKPVVGKVEAPGSGLKLLIGYDILVLIRPKEVHAHVSGSRSGGVLTLRNDGNVSVMLANGQQCDAHRKCTDVSGGRLYAGAEKTLKVASGRSVEFQVQTPTKTERLEF